MPKIIPPYVFRDGETLDAARLDANYKAFTDVLNGGLDEENLRPSAGITNAMKAAPYSWLPLSFTLPVLAHPDGVTFAYAAPAALLNYPQRDTPALDGVLDAMSALPVPARLYALQGLSRANNFNLQPTDALEARLHYREHLKTSTSSVSRVLTTNSVALTLVPGEPLIDHLRLEIYANAAVHIPAPGTARYAHSLVVVAWLKVKHFG